MEKKEEREEGEAMEMQPIRTKGFIIFRSVQQHRQAGWAGQCARAARQGKARQGQVLDARRDRQIGR